MLKLYPGLAALTIAAWFAHIGGVAADTADSAKLERGRYLTIVGDCAACHTAPGGAPFAGGLPIETPFGKLVSPNITPDRETGIGAWNDDEFVNSLLRGTGRSGQRLYPAMPYVYYTKMSRDDALAIRAYLDTVTPVQHAVEVNHLSFPVNIRTSMAVWNALFFHEGAFQPVPGKSAQWNRGAYLVTGPMHCGACHTSKNFLGADQSKIPLQGYRVQGWFAPDIANDPQRGLGAWSTDEIVAYLKTGHNGTAAATGPMAEEVARSSSQMNEADLQAVAAYLADVPGPAPVVVPPPPADLMIAGEAIYADECSSCHFPAGKGVAGLFPRLADSSCVRSQDPISLIHVVLRGTRSVATAQAPTAAAMPSFGWLLTDSQIAAVTTYVRNSWGNAAPSVSVSDVSAARHKLAGE